MFEATDQGKKTVLCYSDRKDQINLSSQIHLYPVCIKDKLKPDARNIQVY